MAERVIVPMAVDRHFAVPPLRGQPSRRAAATDVDTWKGERLLVGTYGLRRTLIDLAIEWDVPAHIADLLSCHATPPTSDQSRTESHGLGTRTGVYMNARDTQLLLQVAKVMQRAPTKQYVPLDLGFDDEDL